MNRIDRRSTCQTWRIASQRAAPPAVQLARLRRGLRSSWSWSSRLDGRGSGGDGGGAGALSTGGSGSACRSGSRCWLRACRRLLAFSASGRSGAGESSRARRAVAGDDARPLPPGNRQQIADVLQLPDLLDEPAQSSSPAMVRLAVRQRCEALAESDWRSLWNRKRTPLLAGCSARRRARPDRCSPSGPRRGSAERGTVAAGLVGALAAADVSDRDGPGHAAGSSPRATSGSRSKSGPTCPPSSRMRQLVDHPRPRRTAVLLRNQPASPATPPRFVSASRRRRRDPRRRDGRDRAPGLPLRVSAVGRRRRHSS